MTAKELKEALANVPDDAEVLVSVYSEDLGCDVPCPTHKVVKNCDKNIVIV
jgi:hypothetical protein